MFGLPDEKLFRMALQDIAAGADVATSGKKLIVRSQSALGQSAPELSAEQMAHVLGFIRSNADLLEAGDTATLTKLQGRLSSKVPEKTREDIDKVFKRLIKYDATKADAKLPTVPPSLTSDCSTLEIGQSATLLALELAKLVADPWLCLTANLSVVREPPANWNAKDVLDSLSSARTNLGAESPELLSIIDKVISRYQDPNVVLLTTLKRAVLDTNLTVNADLSISEKKPKDWSRTATLAALEQVRARTDPKEVQLIQVIDRLIEDHEPPRLVKLALCIAQNEHEDDIGSIRMSMRNWLATGLPVLTTKTLITGDYALPQGDVYSQKNGGLAICVPTGFNVADLGINLEAFELVLKDVRNLECQPFDHEKDLQQALVQPKEGPQIHRLIVAMGHGMPAEFAQGAQVCGLSAIKFQEMMQVLSDKGMAFLSLISCYSGGENSAQVTLPNGSVPCPILVTSATETVSLGDPETLKKATSLLDEAGLKLFSPLISGRTPRLAHQLQRQDLAKMGHSILTTKREGIWSSDVDQLNLHNLQTVLLPSKRSDVPRVTYFGAAPDSVVDLDNAAKNATSTKLRSSEPGKEANPVVKVNGDTISTLFCSGPKHKGIVEVSGKPITFGILARGGDSVHFIDELRIPTVTLADFVLESVNKVGRSTHGVPPRQFGANVLFYFGALRCKDENGQPIELHNVTITLTRSNADVTYTDADGKHFTRKIALNLNPANLISQPKTAAEVLPQQVITSEYDLIFNRFDQFLLCCPSKEHLLATTGGQLSARDLSCDLADRLSKDLSPSYVEICRLALDSTKSDILLEKLKSLPLEEQNTAVNHAVRLAVAADNMQASQLLLAHFGPWNRPLVDGKTALHLAAQRGSLEVAKMLLQNIDAPDQQDNLGRTALHYAVMEYHSQIVDLLRDHCSDTLIDSTSLSSLDYALLNERQEFIQGFLTHKHEPIELDSQRKLLVVNANKPAQVRLIIDSHRVPISGHYIDNQSFFECCVLEAAPISSLKLLVEAGCAQQETKDADGHGLLARLLLEGKYLNEEAIIFLSDLFPLSSSEKLLLSQRWLEQQQKEPHKPGNLRLMKLLSIPAEPSQKWQELLMPLDQESHDRIDRIRMYLDVGVQFDWKSLGELMKKVDVRRGGLSSEITIIKQIKPDLSNDENWKTICAQCIRVRQWDLALPLINCGVQPPCPKETQSMTSEQLFSWYLEDPKRIQLFIQSLASGVIQIDEKGTNAKACLAYVTGQGTKDEKLEWAINLMIKKGVVI